jgi:methionyl-tRNA synthetase
MVTIALQPALSAVWDIVARANAYLVEKEPWKLAKDPANRDELAAVLYASAETLRLLAVAIHPIMPAAAASLWSQLGQSGDVADAHLPASGAWGGLAPGTATTKGESLFPRVEHDES